MILGLSLRVKCIVCLGIILLQAAVVRAQDPQFSQFFANPMYTNPAFAGSSYVARGVMNYRSQWPSISGTIRTFSASYDEHFDVINGGVGIIATRDEAGVGVLTTTAVSGVYAYQINVSKTFTVRASLQAGFQQLSIQFDKLSFYDQLAKGRGIVRPTQEQMLANPNPTYPVVSTGFIGYSNNFYGGFAIHNLNEPARGFFGDRGQNLPMRYTVHGGMMIPLIKNRDESKSVNLWPNVLYWQQLGFNQLNLGMYINRDKIVGGMYFRQNSDNSDAVIMLIGMRLPKVRIGFSYDATLSDARVGARQSFEVSLAFELKKRTPKQKLRPVKCPEF
jgi:type IX secretion system PorP/SprF family membrane protein